MHQVAAMHEKQIISAQASADSATPPAAELAQVTAIIEAHRHLPGSLLPILHAIQDVLGFIPQSAVPAIAAALNYSRAEVHGVVTFYHHFRRQPAGRHVVQLCRAEACQAVGARALEAHAKQILGIEFHETTGDGAITLEPVYCLGNCACGPSLRIGDAIVGRVNTQRFDALVNELRDQTQ